PVSFVMVAPVAPLSLTVKVSVSSTVVSAQTGTVMVLIVSLGAKIGGAHVWTPVRVPVAAAAQLLLPVAVPSTVVKPTVADWVVAPVLDRENVRPIVSHVLPSYWLSSSIASVGAVSSFTIVPVPVSFVVVAVVAPLS